MQKAFKRLWIYGTLNSSSKFRLKKKKTFKSERNEFETSIRTVLKVIPVEDEKNIFMMNSFSSHP